MGLNPNFVSQGDRPLPVLFGYSLGNGDEVLGITDPSDAQIAFVLFGDGEHDGVEQFALTDESFLHSLSGTPFFGTTGIDLLKTINFHSGSWTAIGLPNLAGSTGPDQGFDTNFAQIPAVTPPQSFSNISYGAFNLPLTGGSPLYRGVTTAYPLKFFGILRGARCRYFDAEGNVTGYGFTTNPTWHMVEALLRYKFKRQQPQIAGLTTAERACFNWPAIAAHAAYNDAVLANGANRFTGNYVFASQATLASMLETMLRCCQSYIDDQDGKIAFYNFQPIASSFTLTGNHVFPGSFKCQKKDLTSAPNVFVPKFRDINIAALVQVISVNMNNYGATAGSSSPNNVINPETRAAYFNTDGVNPFSKANIFFYGDSSNPALNGDYETAVNVDPTITVPQIWAYPMDTSLTDASADDGYIGTQTSRFGQRAPTTVQHRAHQAAAGQISPGITALPRIQPVEYDLGNMSYDQANRLMQYMRNSTLGNDGPGWTAPLTGSVKVRLDAVDANGNAFVRLRPNQRFAIDATVSPEFAGDYIIDGAGGGMTIIPPSKSEPLGAIQVNFKTYNGNAFTDVSDPPDQSLLTIASAALPYVNSSLQMPNVAWLISCSVAQSVGAGGLIAVSITDLVMQVLGRVGFTNYGSPEWGNITSGAAYVLYVDDPGNGQPVFGAAAGASLPAGSPSYRYVILAAIFDGTNILGTGATYGSLSS